MVKTLMIVVAAVVVLGLGWHFYGGAKQQPAEPDKPHKITLNWEKAARAVSYNVYRRNYRSGDFSKVGTADAPTFEDANVKSGERYCYEITSVDAKGAESARSSEMCQTVPRP
jgi:fibronectin type 3 domain-containing protein